VHCDYCGGILHDDYSCQNCGAPSPGAAGLLCRESSEARYLRMRVGAATTTAESMEWALKHEAVRQREEAQAAAYRAAYRTAHYS
jgi:hypothetical protein